MSDAEMQARLDELLAADRAEARKRDLDCEAEARRLAEPRFAPGSPEDVALRGGQPGTWFDMDNDGFASYEQAGNSNRQQMERQLERTKAKSAFSKH